MIIQVQISRAGQSTSCFHDATLGYQESTPSESNDGWWETYLVNYKLYFCDWAKISLYSGSTAIKSAISLKWKKQGFGDLIFSEYGPFSNHFYLCFCHRTRQPGVTTIPDIFPSMRPRFNKSIYLFSSEIQGIVATGQCILIEQSITNICWPNTAKTAVEIKSDSFAWRWKYI